MATDSNSSSSVETRKLESSRIISKHPDRIPIICERSTKCNSQIPPIDKKKYLVPKDMTVGQFVYVVRKRILMKPEDALFVFASSTNILPQSSSLISEIYSKYSNEDGFLYMEYSGENTLGV